MSIIAHRTRRIADVTGTLTTRLRLVDDRVWLTTETDGGSIIADRCLGHLSRDLDYDVPTDLWGQIAALLDEQEDAEQYGRDCRSEALRRY